MSLISNNSLEIVWKKKTKNSRAHIRYNLDNIDDDGLNKNFDAEMKKGG